MVESTFLTGGGRNRPRPGRLTNWVDSSLLEGVLSCALARTDLIVQSVAAVGHVRAMASEGFTREIRRGVMSIV